MIAETTNNTIIRSNIQNESFFSIKEENQAHIFSILRSQLYSDKLLAVIREYSTNALDAHVASNVNVPIKITLPSIWCDGKFTIRDYGNGLSYDDIINVFASYGESTKRNTNNQVGMLGLGSKSAFAYTNTFIITSYNNGIKSVYNAFIDESNKGVVSLVSTEGTDETGIEICIPIKSEDSKQLYDKCYNFFKYWDVTPSFNNRLNEDIKSFKQKPYILKSDGWFVTRQEFRDHSLLVHMGNICYPVNVESARIPEEKRQLFRQNYYAIHLTANIGDVTNSASRESLELNDKTIKWINNSIDKIYATIEETINQKVADCNSLYEAKALYNELSNTFLYRNTSFLYNGQKISNQTMKIYNSKIRTYHNGIENRARIHETITCNHDTTFYIASPCVPEYNRKSILKQYLSNNNLSERVTVITFNSDIIANTFMIGDDMVGAKLVHLKDLPQAQVYRTSTKRTKKEDAEVYIFKNQSSKNSDYWDINQDVDLDEEKIYVMISRYTPEQNNLKCEFTNETLCVIQRILLQDANPNYFNSNILVGIKNKNAKTINKSWISLKDAIIRKCNTLYETHKDGINKLLEAESVPFFYTMLKRNIEDADVSNPDIKFMLDLKQYEYEAYKYKTALYDIRKLSEFVDYKIPYTPHIVEQKHNLLMDNDKINAVVKYIDSPRSIFVEIANM